MATRSACTCFAVKFRFPMYTFIFTFIVLLLSCCNCFLNLWAVRINPYAFSSLAPPLAQFTLSATDSVLIAQTFNRIFRLLGIRVKNSQPLRICQVKAGRAFRACHKVSIVSLSLYLSQFAPIVKISSPAIWNTSNSFHHCQWNQCWIYIRAKSNLSAREDFFIIRWP